LNVVEVVFKTNEKTIEVLAEHLWNKSHNRLLTWCRKLF
jgi:hypothetical protein